ncbi:MAG: signal recognition particle receptor subunit alpha, partial [Chlorobi bacterium]|nr:signal recognition particle receptor subunit alpha [Chlorobiota bacterium]
MGFFKKLKNKVDSVVDKTSEKLGFNKLQKGLEKTRHSFVDRIQSVLGSGRKIDNELLDEIEEILLTADIGINTTDRIIEDLRERVKKDGTGDSEDIYSLLKDEMKKILIES